MRTIATLQEPDSGSITFDGTDVLRDKEAIRKLLGYLPQEFGVYPRVSAEMLLDHLAVLKGIHATGERKTVVEALLHKTNLWEHRKKNLGGYSGGMKQRFGIAQALLANPRLIIVDEPTAGLDPAERNRFHNLLAEIGEEAVVILSTHIVDDVKELCTDMAIINRGKILMQGNPLEALATMDGQIWSRRVDKTEVARFKDSLNVISDKMIAGKPELRVFATAQPDESWQPAVANLEDVYFAKISQQLAG
jgi:ABC-type multidrug transport system ATPase subunit